MAVEVTARHMEQPEGAQDYARGKAEVLIADFPRIEHVHVILDIEKHRNTAKIVVQAKNHIRFESDEESDDMYVSIDTAIDKMERRLRKNRDRIQDHRSALKRTPPPEE